MLKAVPFVMLDGKAAEAIAFYEKALGATLVFKQTYGESPESTDIPKEDHGKLAHSVLRAGEAEWYVADVFPGFAYRPGNPVSLCLITKDAEEAKRYYEGLLEGGQVEIPLGPVHFSPAYGMVTDKFGVVFQIAAARPKPSSEEA